MTPKPQTPYAAWHAIYNLDGTFRGYEYALDRDGNPRPSQVYAQEGRDANGAALTMAGPL